MFTTLAIFGVALAVFLLFDPPAELPRAGTDATPTLADAAEAHARAFLAERQLSDLKAALDEMRGQRDPWLAQVEQRPLTDARARRPWWKRLAG
jgi:hypothetical protein